MIRADSFDRCPDSSILAAFVEGTLDRETRRNVERHLADCAECPTVVAETVRFLLTNAEDADAADGAEVTQRNWWWLAAAVAALALCIPAVVWYVSFRDPLRRAKSVSAELSWRPIEGRLAGFPHAPFSAARSQSADGDSVAWQAETDRLSDRDSAHVRGVTLLLAGDTAAAVEMLREAATESPEHALIWNDLAAAYIARDAPLDRTRALEAADRAIALNGALASAHFNRAIALQRLRRQRDAVEAYRRSVALDPDSAWSREAVQRVHDLQQ